jgi:hypothetical protein
MVVAIQLQHLQTDVVEVFKTVVVCVTANYIIKTQGIKA